MYIPIFMRPGSHLDIYAVDPQGHTQLLLMALESEVRQAALCLHFFCESFSNRRRGEPGDMRNRWKAKCSIGTGLQREGFILESKDYAVEYARRVATLELAVDGVNGLYTTAMPHLHATSFLFAADTFLSILEELADRPGCPAGIPPFVDSVKQALPNLHALRNSAAHIEDRLQGKYAQGKNSYEPGIEIATINAANQTMRSRIQGGGYGEISITETTVRTLEMTCNQVLQCYPWQGPWTAYR